MPHIRLPDPKEVDAIVKGDNKRAEMGERKLKISVGNALQAMPEGKRKALLGRLRLSDDRDLSALLAKDKRLRDTELYRFKALIAAIHEADTSGLSRYPGAVEDTRKLEGQEWTDVSNLARDVVAIMQLIARGSYDVYVENVFGKAHAGRAKEIFGEAASALEKLRPGIFNSQIFVDTLKKREVWCCGALTNSTSIVLSEHTVAAAKDRTVGSPAFLTLVHEATHAIPDNRATRDTLYEHHEGFRYANPEVKLTTADYYKEVVRQIANGGGPVFNPQDASPHLGEKRSPVLRQAASDANMILNAAWITAMRIHGVVRTMAIAPGRYVGWETWLRNASRLMGITLHREEKLTFASRMFAADIGPTITAGDLAAIDNRIAMLAACNGKAAHVMFEPSPEERDPIDHVLRQVLSMCWGDLKFLKDREKDVIVIRSLAACHETSNQARQNLLLDPANPGKPGLAELPEPMKSYLERKKRSS
jgi:hypothetical protein